MLALANIRKPHANDLVAHEHSILSLTDYLHSTRIDVSNEVPVIPST